MHLPPITPRSRNAVAPAPQGAELEEEPIEGLGKLLESLRERTSPSEQGTNAPAETSRESPQESPSGLHRPLLTAQQNESATGDGDGDSSTSPMRSAPSRARWKMAGRKVAQSIGFSRRFMTLRDQHAGVNEVQLSQLVTIRKLGEGAFATVEQCLYTPPGAGQPLMVAVKKLKPDIVSHEDDLASFISEVALMRKLKHKHIVEYIGVGSTDNSSAAQQRSTMFLVSELMDGGTLKQLVMKQLVHPHKVMYTHQQALRWAIHIAEALAYLHSANPLVIHRDLKLENCLLKGKHVSCQEAKLADFGLVATLRNLNSKPGYRTAKSGGSMAGADVTKADAVEKEWLKKSEQFLSKLHPKPGSRSSLAALMPLKGDSAPVKVDSRAVQQLSGRTGTYMYMAPEMFNEQPYTEKVDVFSFAVIMAELFNKYMMVFAVSVAGTEEEIEHYAEKVAGGWRPPLAHSLPEELRTVITDAWAQDPSARPSMEEIVTRLKRVQEQGLLEVPVQGEQPCCTIC